MAGIGLKDFKWAPLKDDNLTYDTTKGLKSIVGAIESKPKYNFNEATLSADDKVKERIKIFKDGDLTMGIDDDHDEVFDEILGKTRSTNEESVSNVDDIPKFVGLSQIVTKIIDNVKKYKVEFLTKVQFTPFISEAKTKGDSLEFTTPSVEAKFYENAEGDYEKHKTFSTYEEAVEYQKSLFGITDEVSNANDTSDTEE